MPFAFSSSQMKKLLHTKVLPYPDLAKYRSLDQLFGSKKYVIILVLTISDEVGHWTALLRNPGGQNKIEVFDSFGEFPDAELKHLSPEFRAKTGQRKPLLLPLLIDGGVPVEYSDRKLQRDSPDVTSCGPHCVVRCLAHDLSNNEYCRQLMELSREVGASPDAVVTHIAESMLRRS